MVFTSREGGADLDAKWPELRLAVRECLLPGVNLTDVEFMPLYLKVCAIVFPKACQVDEINLGALSLYAYLCAHLYAHTRACANMIVGRTHEMASTEEPHLYEALQTTAVCELARYETLWNAYEAGILRIELLFYSLEQWHENNRLEAVHQSDDNLQDVAFYPVHRLALIAWRDEVMKPLAPLLLQHARVQVNNLRDALLAGQLPHDAAETQRLIRVLCQSIVVIGKIEELKSPNFERFWERLIRGDLRVCPKSSVANGVACGSGAKARAPPDPLRKAKSEIELAPPRLYQELCEKIFHDDAVDFYRRLADNELSKPHANIQRYVRDICFTALEREIEFSKTFLHHSSLPLLRDLLQYVLVRTHEARLFSAVDDLLREAAMSGSVVEFRRNRGFDDLRVLSSALRCVPTAFMTLSSSLQRQAFAAGTAVLQELTSQNSALDELLIAGCNASKEKPSPAQRFVHDAWKVYSILQTVAVESFDSSVACLSALHIACEGFVNRVDAAPALVAQFIHEVLETPHGRAATIDGSTYSNTTVLYTNEEADTWAIRAARLFRFISDKLAFQRVYAKRLARRLIFGTMRSRETEREVIDLLGSLCGPDYTSRLKRMFLDVENSVQHTDGFVRSQLHLLPFDLDVLVLSSAAWPIDGKEDENTATSGGCDSSAQGAAAAVSARENQLREEAAAYVALPSRIGIACARFVQYYTETMSSFTRLRFNWVYRLCRVSLSARIVAGGNERIRMEVSLAQAAILLHLDDYANCASPRVLSDLLGMSLTDTLEAVSALVRAGVLVKVDGVENEEMAQIQVAERLPSGGTLRVALVVIGGKKEKDETEREGNMRDEDRRTQLAAIMVKVMKMQRRMNEVELFVHAKKEVAAWFLPSQADLERVSRNLVENEYLSKTGTSYEYVP